MKFKDILLIILVVAALGVAGIFLTPEKLSTKEEDHAIQNRKEIIKALDGAEGDTTMLDEAIKRERQEQKTKDSL
jgi:hypothetical protein